MYQAGTSSEMVKPHIDTIKNMAARLLPIIPEGFGDVSCTDIHKITYTLNLLKERRMISNIIVKNDKNDTTSTMYRTQGNDMFKCKNYYGALVLYNKSLAFAVTDSETLGLGFGNRSAALYELKKYAECVDQIQKAEECKYPADRLVKLKVREDKCLKLMKIRHNLKAGPHGKHMLEHYAAMQGISRAVRIVHDNAGHRLVSENAIRAGEVLAVEKPYCMLLDDDKRYTHCTFCLQNPATLIPCKHCPNVMFCNARCSQQAWETFHKMECPLFATFMALDFGDMFKAVRVAAVAISTCTANELRTVLSRGDANASLFTGSLQSEQGKYTYNSADYAAVHMLLTQKGRAAVHGGLEILVAAAVTLHLITKDSEFAESTANNDIFALCANVILQNIMNAGSIMHSVSYMEHIRKIPEFKLAGLGVLPFHSLYSHSCVPNIGQVYRYIGGELSCVSVAVAPIKKDDLLTIANNYHHCIYPRFVRQEALFQRFGFRCHCDACRNDFPLERDLPVIPTIPQSLVDIEKLSLVEALDEMPEYIYDLNILAEDYPDPNKQVFQLQNFMLICLCIQGYQEILFNTP